MPAKIKINRVKLLNLSQLHPNPTNPKLPMGAKYRRGLSESLKEFGFGGAFFSALDQFHEGHGGVVAHAEAHLQDTGVATRTLCEAGAQLVEELGHAVAVAQAVECQAAVGNVKIVRGQWNTAFLDELCEFPMGKHDDQVDTASGAFNKLALRKVMTSY